LVGEVGCTRAEKLKNAESCGRNLSGIVEGGSRGECRERGEACRGYLVTGRVREESQKLLLESASRDHIKEKRREEGNGQRGGVTISLKTSPIREGLEGAKCLEPVTNSESLRL